MSTTEQPLTVGDYVAFLAPGLLGSAMPAWPPDVFAVAASLLKRTGAYTRAAELLPRDGSQPLLASSWPGSAARLASEWRRAFDGRDAAPPAEVATWWAEVQAAATQTLADVTRDDALVATLLRLTGVADEACAGVGVTRVTEDGLLRRAETRLALPRNAWSSLCDRVRPDRVRVLPKQHAPQRGLTLRSLSHHLSLHPANDVRVAWRSPVALDIEQERERFNLLVLPWPAETSPRDFQVVDARGDAGPLTPDMPARYRFFRYARQQAPAAEFGQRLRQVLESAERAAGPVDAVVLPELALTPAEYEEAEQCALERGVLLVAGIAGPLGPGSPATPPQNMCAVQWGGLTAARAAAVAPAGDTTARERLAARTRIVQAKHHRWCLDRGQILQYRLGGVLPASRDCWELTDVGERAVTFVTLGNWLTLSVLICEDLARQDPVADVLRAVGPNLVVALLMDGPQLSSRWGARYASVLAEDPGSSVLTLTSLGMSRRSQPRPGSAARPGVIGLWRDAKYGERELELPPGCEAGVLSLTGESLDEFTADGRPNSRAAHFPVFAGFEPAGV